MKAPTNPPPASPWPMVVSGAIFAAFLLGMVALGQAKLAGVILLVVVIAIMAIFA